MGNTRKIDNEWMETDCPTCGHTYLWHIEERNLCTGCGADYGKLITDLAGYFRMIRCRIRRDYLEGK